MRRLVLIAQPRTGSNLAQDLIGNAPNVLIFREIFNPDGVFGLAGAADALDRLAHTLDRPRICERDPEAVAFAAARPGALIALLAETARAADRDAISFTIFPGQLSEAALAPLLADRRSRPVLLTRRHLHRHVSFLTAKRSGVWKGKDTSQGTVTVDLDVLAADLAASEAWYAKVLAVRTDARHLRYEDDLCLPPRGAFACVRRVVPWLSPLPPGVAPVVRMARQDWRDDVFDRVTQGAALRAALERSGRLARALSRPVPAFRPV